MSEHWLLRDSTKAVLPLCAADLVMGVDQFLLTWNNHRSNLAEVFTQLRVQVGALTSWGEQVKANMILNYFKSLLMTLHSAYFDTLFFVL